MCLFPSFHSITHVPKIYFTSSLDAERKIVGEGRGEWATLNLDEILSIFQVEVFFENFWLISRNVFRSIYIQIPSNLPLCVFVHSSKKQTSEEIEPERAKKKTKGDETKE